MKAAVFHAPTDMRFEDLPIPQFSDNELLLKVGACAICGSDVRTYRFGAGNISGKIIMGHEVTGTIVDTGAAVKGLKAGQRVAVAPAVPCGACIYCQRGVQTMCNNLRSIGYEFNGGFAEYMVVPETAIRAGCVNPIPDNLSFAEAAIAEPLACAINGQELLNTGMGDTVAIIGAGPLGCMHAQLAKARGAVKVIMIEVQARRLEMAREFGADVLVDSSSENAEQRVREETEGLGASVVIVCAPSAAAQEQSLLLAAKHGRISFFGGLPKSNPTVSLNANLVHYRELFIMGAYGSKPRHNRAALDLLATGKIKHAGLIGATISLDRLLEGLESVAAGKYLKVVVQPDGQ